jgi:hypothetical protein
VKATPIGKLGFWEKRARTEEIRVVDLNAAWLDLLTRGYADGVFRDETMTTP